MEVAAFVLLVFVVLDELAVVVVTAGVVVAVIIVEVSSLKRHFVGNVRKFRSWRFFPLESTSWNFVFWLLGFSKKASPIVVDDPPQIFSTPSIS